MKDFFARMFAHATWANRRVLESLRATPMAQAVGTPLLAHLLAAEHVWLVRLQGTASRHPVWPTFGLDECNTLLTENDAGYQAFLSATDTDELSKPVRYRSTTGEEFVSTASDILAHVVTHGSYHRGQIAKIVGRNGGTAHSTDFIVYTREITTPDSFRVMRSSTSERSPLN